MVVKKAARYTRSKISYVHAQFKDHATTAVIAALSFIIAISWKDLIIKLVKDNINFDSLEKYPYLPDLFTAIIVTIIAIIAIVIVSKWAQKEDKV